MIKKIIDGICKALHEEFGEGYEIYTEGVEQGFEEPCFSIELINSINEQVLKDRYLRKNLFCIYYFPSSNETKNEIQEVIERLYLCLEYIEIEETIKTYDVGTQNLYIGTTVHEGERILIEGENNGR